LVKLTIQFNYYIDHFSERFFVCRKLRVEYRLQILYFLTIFWILLQRKAQQASDRDFKYQQIMRNLVRRYVTVEQRKAESQGVTEDDVNEIKQDISAFRCELVEILKNSGMDTNVTAGQGGGKPYKYLGITNQPLLNGFSLCPQEVVARRTARRSVA